MFTRRHLLSTTFALGLAAALGLPAHAQDKLPVVATFSILGDMVASVGGDRVAVTTLVGPDGDAHVYQPTPADARALADAKVAFVNGLAFEGWMERLLAASEYDGPVVVTTEGVVPLEFHQEHGQEDESAEADHDHAHDETAETDHDHEQSAAGAHAHDHGGVDPHAWQSLANARLYVANIADGLIAADPEGTDAYAANRDAYLAEIDALDAEIRALVESLPENRRAVVTSHDAFGYFGDAYGLTFEAPQGMSTEAEASAADVAALIRQIRGEGIPAVFVENITDRRLLDQIASETGATIGGTLYSDALSGPDGPAGTYLDMMRSNIRTLSAALSS